MCRRKFILSLILILFFSRAFAGVFVVISNADSGTGTLREALTLAAANGNNEKDEIRFNLPGNTEADRTITLLTELPTISSATIIDGSLQPGPAFGVSGAKIIIKPETNKQILKCFYIEIAGSNKYVAFYGLYISGFGYYNNGGAITVLDTIELVIGAPGKGNVICGNAIGLTGALDNASIKSNFWGLLPDGNSRLANAIAIISNRANKLIIGGETPQDGNVFSGNTNGISIGSTDSASFYIKNNLFGTDITGTKRMPDGSIYDIETFITVRSHTTTGYIEKNVFSADAKAIDVSGGPNLSVKGNFFGTDKSATYSIGHNNGEAIEINDFATVVLGGLNPGDENIVTNYSNPIFSLNFGKCEIIKNRFYCNQAVYISPDYPQDKIKVYKLTDNYVSGICPPNATVQLYYSDLKCSPCNPNEWFATITGDSNGFWEYSSPLLAKRTIMASATFDNNTVGFEPFYLTEDDIIEKAATNCLLGSIEIINKREGRFTFVWRDAAGVEIGHDQKIEGLKEGPYTLEVGIDGGCVYKTDFYVAKAQMYISTYNFQLDCNNTIGKFTPSYYSYNQIKTFTWENQAGKIIGNKQFIYNLPIGKYYLTITDDSGCSSEKAEFKVLPALAPLQISGTSVSNPAVCNSNSGSITNITISGGLQPYYYVWTNEKKEVVSYELNLMNALPGIYTLESSDASGCPPVKSQPIEITTTGGVSINIANAIYKNASCNKNNGAITNIEITGATAYKWTRNGTTVATTKDLTGFPAGDYVLIASNATCEETVPLQISETARTIYPNFKTSYKLPCAGESNGEIEVIVTAPAVSHRWVGPSGQFSAANKITGLSEGKYILYVTDANGCETSPLSFDLPSITPLQFVAASGTIINDQCSAKAGSIKNVQLTGGQAPFTYKWLDEAGNTVASTKDATQLSAGNYRLQVSDASGCNLVTSDIYSVTDQTTALAAPVLKDVEICAADPAVIEVFAVQPGNTYRLYNSLADTQPLNEQSSGVFNVITNPGSSYFVSRASGSCESARTEVKITLGVCDFSIPNTFTPNGDGINDVWHIKGIDRHPAANVKIFNRNGQKVFESNGYTKPFNGIFNGKALPAGAYYYIINLQHNAKLYSGTVTILL